MIRTIAGLRPFRPKGFRVEREHFGAKTVIHNYGHGGGGITLSWGTSRLAVDLAPQLPEQVALIGCGVVGLSTARLLQRRGARVTIYTRETPPDTTSNVAGGQWSPTSVFQPSQATPEFQDQFVRAARIAYRYYQTMVGEHYGIRWIQNFILSDPLGEDRMHGPASAIHDLFPEYAEYAKTFGMPARRFTTMLIEPSIYLPALLRDFQIAGGMLRERELQSFEEVPEPMIFNCTDLGAGKLAGDAGIQPAKGQLTFLLPQPEIDYIVLAGPQITYMFPRRDGILLGGSFEPGNWDLAPDAEVGKGILERHRELFGRL